MKAVDLQTVSALLREAGRDKIMPLFRNLADGAVRMKTGPLDLVTVADEAAERRITAGLLREFPGCVVIGEEAASANPDLLRDLPGADLAFVVDPIDGTANFAAGLALFGVMAAVFRRGEIIGAVIHDPVGDDTALALRGEGAWVETPDGRRRDMRVAAPAAQCANGRQCFLALHAGGATLRSAACANARGFAACWDYPVLGARLSNDRGWPWTLPVFTTGCIPGTTRRDGCCIARLVQVFRHEFDGSQPPTIRTGCL